jgi:hypothetical protein
MTFSIIIIIIAFFILLFILFFYYRNEPMTNMEASSILPILYDSSLANKNKITDLLGITVNDISYNQILNAKNKDSDTIISAIKQYIGASVSFNTDNNTDDTKKTKETATPTISSTSTSPASTDSKTTKPTALAISQTPFKDRIS